MIELTGEEQKLAAPAATHRELAERLSYHLGRTIKVEDSMGNFAVGILQWASVSYSYRYSGHQVAVNMGKSSDRNGSEDAIELGNRISVLTDGRWVVIHDPQEKRVSYNEESGEWLEWDEEEAAFQ